MEDNSSPEQSIPETEAQRPNISSAPKRRSFHTPPVYWQHNRSASNATVASLRRSPAITLEDRTEPNSQTHDCLWAKSINIDDYVIVRGNPTGIGAYVVWNCKVETLDGGPMIIRKRYSEFVELRERLKTAFPLSTNNSLPPLPPKSAIYKFRPKFLEKRRQGLAYFLTCVMLNPEYAGSDIIKDFIFSHDS